MTPLISNFVHLFVESAPWLMLGFAIAGIMRVFVPSELLAKHLGEPGFVATAKAAMLGAPLDQFLGKMLWRMGRLQDNFGHRWFG